MLDPKAFKLGNTVSGGDRLWGGSFCLEHFWPGIIFAEGFFHRKLSCRVIDYQRRLQSLIREGLFAKGASNPGAVVPGALAPGPFGSG